MSFESIIGNNKIKKYFSDCVNDKNFLHSYLFLGNDGIGKKLFAKELAKHILCISNSEDECNCKSCVCFDSNNHPDFYIVNEEGESIKIDQIRELIDGVIEKPIISEKKVYIINDCDKMTKEAQNCLLKTLEEPPEFVTMILISSNENLILNTIKSRCTSIKFNNIDLQELKKYIDENLEYTNLTENLLKYFNGSIGKAINSQEKKEKFLNVENVIKNVKQKDFIDFMQDAKIIYDKENVMDFLDYMIVCLYQETKYDKRYLNCISYVNECINRLKSNSYLDMCIDILLFKIWEEVNEKSNRC